MSDDEKPFTRQELETALREVIPQVVYMLSDRGKETLRRIEATALRGVEDSARLDDFATMIRRLVHALRKAETHHELADAALGLLRRFNMQGTPLRDDETDTARAGLEDRNGYRPGPLRMAFVRGVMVGAGRLTNGELTTREDAMVAAKVAYPDTPVTEPSITRSGREVSDE